MARYLKKGLIKPPVPRYHLEKGQERHATWLELLYDLVFAAAISQLAANLNNNYTFSGIVSYSILFIPVWWAWIGHTYYLTRFDSDDIIHRILTMIQIVIVAFLILNIPQGLGETSRGFAISYAAVRSMLVIEYWRAAVHSPRVRPLVNRFITGFGIAAALWAVSILIPVPHRFILWYAAMFIDFLTPISAGQLHVKFPPHLMHLPERFGLFTIIVIGEAIVNIIMGIKAEHLNPVSGIEGIMGLIISFTLWWGYFDGVKGAGTITLTSKDHIRAYQQWLYSHLPLTMAIVSTAVGVKRIIQLPAAGMLPLKEAWILCGSLGICELSLYTIFLSSYPGRPPDRALRFVIPHYALAFLTCAAGVLGSFMSGMTILSILTGISVLQIILSLRFLPE